MQERDIFTAAVPKNAVERAAFLAEACGDNLELRLRVEQLLVEHEKVQSFFLDAPLPGIKLTVDQPAKEMPGTQIGPYKLLQQIGEGGMGVVYMAEQTEPIARRVALKIIKPGMDTRQVIARFEAERQALALMDHVNIARVLDAGATEQGRPYFVMELVHGVPITKYCDDNRLTPRQRLELFVPVCQAIQHAHQKGIIHRDIKPSNVMVTLYDGKPVPKVIDFGVAKAIEQKLTERTLFTQYGTMVGTLEYMSPEQAEISALGVDTRSDIYSLGVLLYELLTGSTPLSRKRMKVAAFGEILRMIKEEDPPKPSTRLSDSGEALASISAQRHTEGAKLTKLVKGELDWIVMKTLEKDRGRRYETANAFAADVQRYLADETVQACPPSAGYRFRKFVRRNKAALGVAGMVLSCLVLLGSGTGWAMRDRSARQTAVEQEVRLALKEAEQLQEQAKWPEALSAAKRAQGLLAGSGDELRDRVHELRKDLEMVLRLEEISLLSSEINENKFDYASADRAYAKAFADYGIDAVGLPTEQAAERIRERAGVAAALSAAIDDWAYVRRPNVKVGGLALTALAQAADPDPWRQQVREAVKQKDAKALAALAASPELLRQPPTSLLVLARGLHAGYLVEARNETMRQAQRQCPGDFWINFYLGAALYDTGPPSREDAVSFFRAALAVRPQNVATHNYLGNALRSQKKLDEAVACYRKAIALDPKYAKAHINLALTLRDQKKLDDAIVCFKKAIELDPKSSRTHFVLGHALLDQGKLEEAEGAYRKAIELDPKSSGAHNALGKVRFDQKKLDNAIVCYRKALELDPKFVFAHFNVGLALERQGKLDDAVAAYRKAIELDPKLVQARHSLGDALSAQGKLDEAIACYKKAIELDPKYVIAHNNLGVALKSQTKVDEAIAEYRAALRLNPDGREARRNLAVALLDKGLVEEAVDECRELLRRHPDYALGYYTLILLQRKGLVDEAIAAFREARRLEPDNAHARDKLGSALTKKGWELANHPEPKLRDPKRAVEAGKEAVELTPQSASAWQRFGWIEYRAGNWRASVEALEKSCKLQEGGTGDAFQWLFLAMAHWQLGHKEEARKWYDKAIEFERVWPEELRRFRSEVEELLGVKETKK